MRVYILDDEPVIRAGLRQTLSMDPELSIVGEAGSARDAFRDIETLHLDVVIMDLVLPGMDGVAATREVKRRVPRRASSSSPSTIGHGISSTCSRPAPRGTS